MGAGSRSLLLLTAAALTISGCERVQKALYSPKVKVACRILEKQCVFRNYGDPGEACVEVTVFHLESGRTLRSRPACSGRIDRKKPAIVDLVFDEADPTTVCMGEGLDKDFKKSCEVEIKELDEL